MKHYFDPGALWLRANTPQAAHGLRLAAAFQIEAEAKPQAGEKAKPRKFTMTAYNGGAMNVGYFSYPVVVDLAGIQGTDKARPIFKNHDPDQLVGHTESIKVEGASLVAAGAISGGGDYAKQVLEAHDNGFPWQASIGARVLNMEFVKEGSSATVNGKTFNGPINVARKTVLGEISFVPLGADDSTSAQIAATAAGDAHMNFEQWLKARGLTLDGLNDVQVAAMRVVFDAEVKAGMTEPTVTAQPKPGQQPANNGADTIPNVTAATQTPAQVMAAELEKARKGAADESERIAGIRRICAEHKPDEITVDGKKVNLEAHAIKAGWDVTKAELEAIRAARPKAPGMIVRDDTINHEMLEAAVCLAGGMRDVPSLQGRAGIVRKPIHEAFAPKTLDAAQRRFRHGIGLQELFLEAAWANGYTGRNFRSDMRGVVRAAMIQADGFSSYSLAGILGNVANKFLIDGFSHVESTWRLIAARRPVNDFKTVTSYRMTGSLQFDKIGPDGEIKHGTVSETSFTNKADTYAKLLAITRVDYINDDLGALTGAPKKLGRGAALKLNDVFWTTFINNSTFFTTGHANYFTGSTTNLQSSSLKTSEQKFADQVDEDGKPIAVMPAVLLVPTNEKRNAMELMSSSNYVAGGQSTGDRIPSANTFQGAYTVGVSAYLSNSSYTGYSTTAWYLLANPEELPTIEVAFLNGQEQPVVEQVDMDADLLGVALRGYFDFGVGTQDYRGGVKSKGAA